MGQTATPGEALTPGQVKFLEALLSAPSVTVASERAGINRRTGARWLHHDPAFQEALREAKAEAIAQAVTLVSTLATSAVTVLATNLKSPSPGIQVRAAQILLETALKVGTLQEQEARLAEMESLIQEVMGAPSNGHHPAALR